MIMKDLTPVSPPDRGSPPHEVEPLRLSFVANVQLLKRAQPQSGAFPPSAPAIA